MHQHGRRSFVYDTDTTKRFQFQLEVNSEFNFEDVSIAFETNLRHMFGGNSQRKKLCLNEKRELKVIQDTKFPKNREN